MGPTPMTPHPLQIEREVVSSGPGRKFPSRSFTSATDSSDCIPLHQDRHLL